MEGEHSDIDGGSVMCGRTGLSLHRESARCACAYLSTSDKTYRKPDWSDEYNDGRSYTPSNNIAPTDITPVLVSSHNFQESGSEIILKPMLWGMIPPWHKGDYTKHGLSTNNCRIEGIFSSKLYGAALHKGNRCVVIAEGFYEWQTTDKTKQPYFIYSVQNPNMKIDEPATWNNEFDEKTGWKGVKLLRMAGLYNTWIGATGPIFSYSVITLESNDTLNWLHHRMPAILDSDEIVEKWLNTKNVNAKDAVSLIRPVEKLLWHPVSTLVNNSHNKSQDCNRRISLDTKNEQSSSQKTITSWLSKSNDRRPVSKSQNSIMKNWLEGKAVKRKSEESHLETKIRKTEQD